MKILLAFLICVVCSASAATAGDAQTTDSFETSGGDLAITFIGHGSLMMEFSGKTIFIDPWSRLADYTKLPDADLILITHHHRDHLDPAAIQEIRSDKSVVVCTAKCAEEIDNAVVMKNGDKREIAGIGVEALPAYNLVHMRDNGQPYHPKGEGNGYVLTFADKRVFIAGDTENIPEMKALRDIDIAFLPMNLPYTMTPEMVADAANAFKPKILYPYHYGETDTARLVGLLEDSKDMEIRIRNM